MLYTFSNQCSLILSNCGLLKVRETLIFQRDFTPKPRVLSTILIDWLRSVTEVGLHKKSCWYWAVKLSHASEVICNRRLYFCTVFSVAFLPHSAAANRLSVSEAFDDKNSAGVEHNRLQYEDNGDYIQLFKNAIFKDAVYMPAKTGDTVKGTVSKA